MDPLVLSLVSALTVTRLAQAILKREWQRVKLGVCPAQPIFSTALIVVPASMSATASLIAAKS